MWREEQVKDEVGGVKKGKDEVGCMSWSKEKKFLVLLFAHCLCSSFFKLLFNHALA